MNRREFLKSTACLSLWAVTPKALRVVPAVETEPPEEVLEEVSEELPYENMYFCRGWTPPTTPTRY